MFWIVFDINVVNNNAYAKFSFTSFTRAAATGAANPLPTVTADTTLDWQSYAGGPEAAIAYATIHGLEWSCEAADGGV